MKFPIKTKIGVVPFFTVIGVVVGLSMLGIAIFGIYATQQAVDNTARSVEKLEELVNKSTEQLELLNQQLKVENQAVLELAHQTIVQTYDNEKKHTVKLEPCNYDESNKQVTYQLVILDKIGLPTKVSFQVKTSWTFYTHSENTQNKEYPPLNGTYVIIKPGSEERFTLDIFEIFEKIDVKSTELYIRPHYSFAPYSQIKNVILSLDIEQIEKEGLLIGLEKNNFGNDWIQITENIKSICK